MSRSCPPQRDNSFSSFLFSFLSFLSFFPLFIFLIFGILDWNSAATSLGGHCRIKGIRGSSKGAETHLPELGDRPPVPSQYGKAQPTSSSPCRVCLLSACVRNFENEKCPLPLTKLAGKQARQQIIMKGQREIKRKGNALQGCGGRRSGGLIGRVALPLGLKTLD